MIWNELTQFQKDELFDEYNQIKYEIKKLNSDKANKSKKHIFTQQEEDDYNKNISESQNKYNTICADYKCDMCGKIVHLNLDKMKQLFKNIHKPIFCSVQCSGKYYANKSHKKSEQEKEQINKKISQTLLELNNALSEQERKEKYGKNVAEYWSNKSSEQKSDILKSRSIKAKQTKLEKYGSETYNNRDKAKQTWHDKYNGIDNILKNQQHLSLETLSIIRDKNKLKTFIESINYKDRTYYNIAKKLGISDSYCNNLILNYNIDKEINIKKYVSRPEQEVKTFIESIYSGEILFNVRNVISPKELDIYIPEKNLAIEVNGAYYHQANTVGKSYHYDKSVACEQLGIRLIHIFDYEWENERQQPILKNIIKNALGINTQKVYARNTAIQVLPSASVKQFFETNNIQGFRGGKFAICLVDKHTNEILMSYIMGNCFFGKGKYEWEVIRGATKLGVTVVGGASKIWKYFIKTYDPNNCVYYVDYNYFNGNSLPYLGLTYITTQLGYKNYWFEHWKTHERNVVKNREPNNHKEVEEAIKSGKGFTVYNAGTKVYVWNK